MFIMISVCPMILLSDWLCVGHPVSFRGFLNEATPQNQIDGSRAILLCDMSVNPVLTPATSNASLLMRFVHLDFCFSFFIHPLFRPSPLFFISFFSPLLLLDQPSLGHLLPFLPSLPFIFLFLSFSSLLPP
ncbi:MAG: hypothetical protein JOS17DRAFT_320835 [Linnemannia elongata]|nr:MAG: hypothetical protein JOS17DRAFT_320835 [Linnemannia elongata]